MDFNPQEALAKIAKRMMDFNPRESLASSEIEKLAPEDQALFLDEMEMFTAKFVLATMQEAAKVGPNEETPPDLALRIRDSEWAMHMLEQQRERFGHPMLLEPPPEHEAIEGSNGDVENEH